MVMYGADPDQLDELARKIKVLGDALAKCHGPVDVQVRIAPWHGPSADRFRHDWARTDRPAILNAAHALQNAHDLLVRNAREQREASGVENPPSHEGGIGGLIHGFAHAVDAGARFTAHGAMEAVLDIGGGLGDVQHGLSEVIHSESFGKIVNSEAFGEVLVAAQILSTIAPFLVVIPVIGPVAAAGIAVGAGAVVLLAHAAQMANRGQWDVKKLGVDAASVVLSGVGLGAAKGALPAASAASKAFAKASSFSLLSKANLESLSGGVRTVVGVRSVATVFTVEASATDVVADLRKGEFLKAATDSFGVVAGAAGIRSGSGSLIHDGAGVASDGLSVTDVAAAEFDVSSHITDIPAVEELNR